MSKSASKRNSLKHGIYSKDPILPGERQRDYNALRVAIFDEWMPEGLIEEALVDDLFDLQWRKARMVRFHRNRLRAENDRVRHNQQVNENFEEMWCLHSEFSEATTSEEVEKLLSETPFGDTIRGWVPREKCEDVSQWGKLIGKRLEALEVEDEKEEHELFAAILDPPSMDLEMLRMERMDDQIDRKLKQLMQVKAYKRMMGEAGRKSRPEPRLVNLPVGVRPALIDKSLMEPATQMRGIDSVNSGAQSALAAQTDMVVDGICADEPVLVPPVTASQPAAPIENGAAASSPPAEATVPARLETDEAGSKARRNRIREKINPM